MADQPLLVWSERLRDYDFGPGHPLTPLRFGPGVDILIELGAERLVAPSVADDAALTRLHAPHYVEQVRSFGDHPWQPPAMGVGTPDVPAFHGMHEAAALVAGGSLGAMDAILAGEAGHAFSPAGGLHHAMRTRAAGFCIYNDVALAVARARDAGHRVLYVDLDVHHGDGTQTLSSSPSTAATATRSTRSHTCASRQPPTRVLADSWTSCPIAGAKAAGWRPAAAAMTSSGWCRDPGHSSG
jgi:acetoin utilization protein AcuC